MSDQDAPPPPDVGAARPPLVCVWCGGTDNEGPWGSVYFCNGCGKSIRRGESQRDAWLRVRGHRDREREQLRRARGGR